MTKRGKQRKAAAGGSPAAAPTAGAAAGPAPTPTAKSANHTAAPSATDTRTSKELLDAVPTTDAARKPDQSDDAPTAAASCASPLAASAKARPAAHAIISKLFEPAVADAAAGGARAPVGDEQEEEEQEGEGAAALGAALGAAFGAEEGGADGGGGGGGGADEDQQVPPLQEPPLDVGLFLDEEVLLCASTFPISPSDLVAKAKGIVAKGVHRCQDQLADDFSFTAPFIGPLGKKAFFETMEGLNLDSAFPDLQPRIYDVRVDPLEPHRVWMTTRPVGRHLGYLKASPLAVPPSGKLVELPPQTSSLTFNEQGLVTSFTMGFVMDRRVGNSGGLGGAFGLLWAIGAPFPYPEGHPWESSWQQRLFNTGGAVAKVAAFLLDRSLTAVLPSWLIAAHARSTN